jgi:hypothetical protein
MAILDSVDTVRANIRNSIAGHVDARNRLGHNCMDTDVAIWTGQFDQQAITQAF